MSRDININDVLIELEDFQIKEQIGKGGFGVVFRAIENKTGKDVACKIILQTETLKKKKEQANILREISVPRHLNLPGIVKLIGFRFPLTPEQIKQQKEAGKVLKIQSKDKGRTIDVDLGGAVIITELMKNGSLDSIVNDYIKTKKCTEKINPTIRSKILFGVAATMKRVHKNNVIHRDLKLENVFLDDNYEPRIADFGLAKIIQNDIEMTMAIGTPYIMAPEIFMDGDEHYGIEVDVYAYAFIIYKMFSNVISFSDVKQLRGPQQYMMKIGRGMRPKRPDNIPDCYWDLIQKCWKQRPEERITFDQITQELRDDKYALEENGVKTNLEDLHEYQNRIDSDDLETKTDSSGPTIRIVEINDKKMLLKESTDSFEMSYSKTTTQRIKNRKSKFIWTRH